MADLPIKAKPLHIGLVACSSEGAALCYRTICEEAPRLLGAYVMPEVSLHGFSQAEYFRLLDAGDLQGVSELMLASAARLAGGGADVVICPDNTIHEALPLLRPRSPVRWLHIAEVVAEEARRRGYQRVGLTGTRWLVRSRVYPDQLEARGLQYVLPTDADRELVHSIIMDELVKGVISERAVPAFQQVIAGMRDAGCDAVVLGCTEIPLVMNDANSPLPTLDSTRLLARAAVSEAIGSQSRSCAA